MIFARTAPIALIALAASLALAATDDDPVTVDQSDWTRITNSLPDSALVSAHERMLEHDGSAAAERIRAAAAFTRVEAGRAVESGRTALESSAADLTTLADKVESEGASARLEIDGSFAKAQHALSVHYHELSARAHEAGDDIAAGHYLARATDNLKGAAAWSGQKLDEGSVATVREGKAAGIALANGAGWAMSKAGDLTVRLGESIQAVGKKL